MHALVVTLGGAIVRDDSTVFVAEMDRDGNGVAEVLNVVAADAVSRSD